MKKREYMKPTVRVVQLHHQCHILAGSDFSTIGTNLEDDEDFIYGGGGSGPGR